MMTSDKNRENEVLMQILELSAEAHVARRRTARGSPAFHKLTGAIEAYGRILAQLTSPLERHVYYAVSEQLAMDEYIPLIS